VTRKKDTMNLINDYSTPLFNQHFQGCIKSKAFRICCDILCSTVQFTLEQVTKAKRGRRGIALLIFNHLTPNGHFSGRTAPLTSRCCIFFAYSTNIRTEYFKHAEHSPFFPLQNVVYFIILPFFGSCIIHILNTGCAKI
jgi:hypothetical protein